VLHFVHAKRADDHPMQIGGDQRPAAAGGSWARFGPGGRGAWTVSAARPLAAGPRAQGDAGRQAWAVFSRGPIFISGPKE
jgi:hypothetical protein